MTTANNCTECEAELAPDAKFCSSCGSEVVVSNEKICPSCGHATESDSNFCPQCGIRVNEKICPSCGHATESDSKFCPQCGKGVKEPEVVPKNKHRPERQRQDRYSNEHETTAYESKLGVCGKSTAIIELFDEVAVEDARGPNWRKIKVILDKAIDLEPSNTGAYLFRSLANKILGLTLRHFEDLEKAKRFTPRFNWAPSPQEFGLDQSDYLEILKSDRGNLLENATRLLKSHASKEKHDRYHDALKAYNHWIDQCHYAAFVKRGIGYQDYWGPGSKSRDDPEAKTVDKLYGKLSLRWYRRTKDISYLLTDADLLAGYVEFGEFSPPFHEKWLDNDVDPLGFLGSSLTDMKLLAWAIRACQVCWFIPSDDHDGLNDRGTDIHFIPPVKGIYDELT